MIVCITRYNAHQFPDVLEQMFRWRYELFVRTRGWDQLSHQDGYERDQFDNADANYLVRLDTGGQLMGGLRLIRTDRPHLLSEVFPHLAPHGVPRGPDIYEMTRYFTVRDRKRAREMRQVAGELLCAMLEFCLMREARWITTAFDTFYLSRMRQNHWQEAILGPPVAYDGGEAIAIQIAVTQENLAATCFAHDITGPVLDLELRGQIMREVGKVVAA